MLESNDYKTVTQCYDLRWLVLFCDRKKSVRSKSLSSYNFGKNSWVLLDFHMQPIFDIVN